MFSCRISCVYSKGKITHEFANTEQFRAALKRHGSFENVVKHLNFVPTDVSAILGKNFQLIGADYSGAFNKGKYNSVFRSYQNSLGQRFEINEMLLNDENNGKLTVYNEALNFDVIGHPATLQKLKGVKEQGREAIYQASTEENALKSLDIFCDQWNHQYPKIGESWRANWENIRTIFSYPAEIRHAIYTTNAIESLNSVIRHSTKKRKIFSSDDSVKRVIYLATSNAAKKWTMPIQNWRLAMNWFTIQFDDRLKDHL
jgi:putative transposase